MLFSEALRIVEPRLLPRSINRDIPFTIAFTIVELTEPPYIFNCSSLVNLTVHTPLGLKSHLLY